jgi:hypothetical protein
VAACALGSLYLGGAYLGPGKRGASKG